MKRMILSSIFLLGSLQAGTKPNADKKVIENRAISGLKASVAAVGVVAALHNAQKVGKQLPEFLEGFVKDPKTNALNTILATAIAPAFAYAAYKLGWEALPFYTRQMLGKMPPDSMDQTNQPVDEQSSSTDKDGGESRIMSGLKMSVAAYGTAMTLTVLAQGSSFLPEHLSDMRAKLSDLKKLEVLLDVTCVFSLLGYSAYKLGWEAVPFYRKQMFGKKMA